MGLRLALRHLVPLTVFGLGVLSSRVARATTCTSDSDCASAFRCDIDVDTECVFDADGGHSCGPGNACVPQWQAPCTDDGECGPGFTCSGPGGYFDCGPRQDAVIPPYATTTTTDCSDIPKPPDPCAGDPSNCPVVPQICEAGTSCITLSWKTCEAQATGPCTVDSDCPSTWTCQCPEDYGPGGPALLADASADSNDAGCTKACIPPNSSSAFGVNAGPSSSPPGSTPTVADSNKSSSGCQIQAGQAAAGAPWGVLMALGCATAWVRRRRTASSDGPGVERNRVSDRG